MEQEFKDQIAPGLFLPARYEALLDSFEVLLIRQSLRLSLNLPHCPAFRKNWIVTHYSEAEEGITIHYGEPRLCTTEEAAWQNISFRIGLIFVSYP